MNILHCVSIVFSSPKWPPLTKGTCFWSWLPSDESHLRTSVAELQTTKASANHRQLLPTCTGVSHLDLHSKYATLVLFPQEYIDCLFIAYQITLDELINCVYVVSLCCHIVNIELSKMCLQPKGQMWFLHDYLYIQWSIWLHILIICRFYYKTVLYCTAL